jgi:hypothetical protein
MLAALHNLAAAAPKQSFVTGPAGFVSAQA